MSSLPKAMRALVQTAPSVASVTDHPVPPVQFASALIKVDTALAHNNARSIFEAKLHYFHLPYPVVPGAHAVGRVAAVGPDAAVVREGQLVLVSSFVRARDDNNVQTLWGVSAGLSRESNRLYEALVRDGVYAQYVLAPLENVYVLDEKRLLGSPADGGLGLSVPELLHLSADSVVYGGLRSIDIKAGERIIITPATGFFSTAAVGVAAAMGASVVATSRDVDRLAQLKQIYPRVETVQLSGDLQADSGALAAFGDVDAVLDMSPPWATGSGNIRAAVSALKPHGRVCLLGGRADESIPISYTDIVFKSLRVQGQWMYTTEDHRRVVKMAESGVLKLGKAAGYEVAAVYGLDEWKQALDRATEVTSWQTVCIKP